MYVSLRITKKKSNFIGGYMSNQQIA